MAQSDEGMMSRACAGHAPSPNRKYYDFYKKSHKRFTACSEERLPVLKNEKSSHSNFSTSGLLTSDRVCVHGIVGIV